MIEPIGGASVLASRLVSSLAPPQRGSARNGHSTFRFMESFDLQNWTRIGGHEPERSCRQRVSVLECGDGVFEVAALGRGGCVGGAGRNLERCQPKRVTPKTPSPQTWRQIRQFMEKLQSPRLDVDQRRGTGRSCRRRVSVLECGSSAALRMPRAGESGRDCRTPSPGGTLAWFRESFNPQDRTRIGAMKPFNRLTHLPAVDYWKEEVLAAKA